METDSRAETLIRLSAPLNSLTVARHSGPGLRLIFWVQGCSLLCTRKCLNPHLLKQEGGCLVTADELARSLKRLANDFAEVEGVTVLGGEPFDQAAALARALAPVRLGGLSIMIYTGHTLEDLRRSDAPGVGSLLALCDILVDGPFLEEQYEQSLVWRGSLNQRILLLSDRYSEEEIERALARQRRAVSISIGARGDISVSGAQSPEAARSLRRLTRHSSPERVFDLPVVEGRR